MAEKGDGRNGTSAAAADPGAAGPADDGAAHLTGDSAAHLTDDGGPRRTGDAAAVPTDDGPARPTGAGAAHPTGAARTPGPVAASPGRVRRGRRAGSVVRTILNALAVAVTVVAVVFVVALLLRIAFAFIPVNPQNAIVGWLDGLADAVVLAFRDLFLPADPRIALAVNYGLAAVFWLVVGLIGARILRGLGRLAAGGR